MAIGEKQVSALTFQIAVFPIKLVLFNDALLLYASVARPELRVNQQHARRHSKYDRYMVDG